MKRLLLMLILSFLFLLNVRLMCVREAQFLLQEQCKGRATCDMPYDQNDEAHCFEQNIQKGLKYTIDIDSDVSLNQVGEGTGVIQNKATALQIDGDQTRFPRLKAFAAQLGAYKKCKKGSKACSVDLKNISNSACCPAYSTVAQTLDESLFDFVSRPCCNEITLQQLIELLNNEIKLVEVLIYPMMGDRYALIQTRSDMLQRSIPSVLIIYDKILSLATHSDLLNSQYAHQAPEGDMINLSLKADDKKIFLHTMYQRIRDLTQKIQNMQYKLAIH